MAVEEEIIIEKMSKANSKDLGLRLLMDEFQSRLYWHIRRMVVSHEETQDILQDTFVKVYTHFFQFKRESKLYTWLYRIATNEALQHLAKAKKMQKSDQDSIDYLQNSVAEQCRSSNEIEVLLQKAIHTLPEKQKVVFLLKYYDDLPYEELSKILSMSVGTLKTNYHYAKEKVTSFIRENATTNE